MPDRQRDNLALNNGLLHYHASDKHRSRLSCAMPCFSLIVDLLLILVLTQGTFASEAKNSQSTEKKYFFPYGACVLCTIRHCHGVERTDHQGLYMSLDVQIDQVLRGPFKNGQNFNFSFDGSPELLPEKPDSEMVGQKCVLAFNTLGLEFGRRAQCCLQDPYAPFPFQRFTDSDVDKLRQKIGEVKMEPRELREAMQLYIERRWTQKRVSDFCRPELRRISGFIPTRKAIGGELYPDAKTEIGEVHWDATLHDGVISYTVDAKRDNDTWNLEDGQPVLVPFTDDDFLIYRIRQTLESCFESYRYTRNFGDQPKPHSPFGENSFRVLRNSKNKITAVECKELDGQTITANLDSGLSIKSILVNGKSDEKWNTALRDVNTNIDKLNAGDVHWHDNDIKDPRARQLLLYYRLLMILWPITIGIIIVGASFGLWRLLRRKTGSAKKYPRKLWFMAALVVPPTFIGLQQLIINFVFRGNMSLTENWIWNVISLGLLFGIIPFMVALTLIGFLQPVWRDPELTKFSVAWFLKRSIPWLLILFAIWCSLLSAFSLTMMG